jgi:hypothetical protein
MAWSRWIGLALLLGCRPSVGLYADHASIEEGIQEQLDGVASEVRCPRRVKLRTGPVMTCEAVFGRHVYPIEVTMVKEDGDWSFTIKPDRPRALAHRLRAHLEPWLEERLGLDSTVDCGEPMPPIVDDLVRCEARFGEGTPIPFTFAMATDEVAFAQRVLPRHSLEADVVRQLAERGDPPDVVSCGAEPALLVPADGIVACTVGVRPRRVRIGDETAELLAD